MELAERFGWGPGELLSLTARQIEFWAEAISERDKGRERDRPAG